MEGERQETIRELHDLIIVAQELGRRLVNETHGESYPEAQKLTEILHQARLELNRLAESDVAQSR